MDEFERIYSEMHRKLMDDLRDAADLSEPAEAPAPEEKAAPAAEDKEED